VTQMNMFPDFCRNRVVGLTERSAKNFSLSSWRRTRRNKKEKTFSATSARFASSIPPQGREAPEERRARRERIVRSTICATGWQAMVCLEASLNFEHQGLAAADNRSIADRYLR